MAKRPNDKLLQFLKDHVAEEILGPLTRTTLAAIATRIEAEGGTLDYEVTERGNVEVTLSMPKKEEKPS